EEQPHLRAIGIVVTRMPLEIDDGVAEDLTVVAGNGDASLDLSALLLNAALAVIADVELHVLVEIDLHVRPDADLDLVLHADFVGRSIRIDARAQPGFDFEASGIEQPE